MKLQNMAVVQDCQAVNELPGKVKVARASSEMDRNVTLVMV